jgi:HPt (histidine-containing phosphotransfer) domain-containing protein
MTTQTDEPEKGIAALDDYSGAVDWGVLESLRFLQKDGKPDLRRELMKMFITTLPVQMEKLRAAAGVSDAIELVKAAHSMKSSSMSIGAVKFGKVCHEIEQRGRAGALEDVPVLVSMAQQEFETACIVFSEALKCGG